MERVARAIRDIGHDCTAEQLVVPNVLAEEYYTRENGARAIHLRSDDERDAFYSEMYAIILRAGGLPSDPATVARVRCDLATRHANRWQLYDDVSETLAALRSRGLAIGVISNTSVDATILCRELEVCDRVDFIVSSCLVGCEKPGGPIFRAALERAGVAADEALHVGDQPRSDVVGALSAGMHALLLDRYELMAEERYDRIDSLTAIPRWVDAHDRPG